MTIQDRISFLFVLVLTAVAASGVVDPPPIIKFGDVSIAILSALHGSGTTKGTCGEVQLETVEEVAAVEWAMETINQQSAKDYTIGLQVYDTCGDQDLAIRQTLALLKDNLSPRALLGVIVLGSASLVDAVWPPLHAYSVPVLVTRSSAAHEAPNAKNVFTTAPHLTAHAQAVVAAIQGGIERQIDGRIGVVSSCAQASRVLKDEASRAGLVLHAHINLTSQDSMAAHVTEFITTHLGYGGTLIALLDSSELNTLLEQLDGTLLQKSMIHWVIALLDGELGPGQMPLQKMTKLLPGAMVIQPHAPLLSGLSHFLKEDQNTSIVASLIEEATQQLCKEQGINPECMPILGLSGSHATAAVKAVSSLAAGFRLLQIEQCGDINNCLNHLTNHLEKDMVGALLKLSYTTSGGADTIRYTADGRLVTSFTISTVMALGMHQVGEYREDTGLVWTHQVGSLPPFAHESDGIQALALSSIEKPQEDDEGIIKTVLTSHQDYVGRTWAFTVLSLACVGVLASLYIAVYVALRVCDGTISGSQLMGGLLLLGVMGTYATCVSYVLPPSAITCRLRAWAPGICLALCYSLLLVKSMHLRALLTTGISGQVSQVSLYISLLFMIGGQILLTLMSHDRSYLWGPPLVLLDLRGVRLCPSHTMATLATQGYLGVLLAIGTLLAIANRNIKSNYNEGRWLLLTSCVSCPIVFAWVVIGYMAPPSMHPPTTSVALLMLASTLLSLVFFPKIRIIAKQAREFRHKKLSLPSSISTVFNPLDSSSAIKPPPAFCDPHQLPPGAILLPPEPVKMSPITSNGKKYHSMYHPSSSNSSFRSSFSSNSSHLTDHLTPREREINARYPIYEVDLNGCYP